MIFPLTCNLLEMDAYSMISRKFFKLSIPVIATRSDQIAASVIALNHFHF